MRAHAWTVGIDEAGRGPLAGPVTVGVFAVPRGFPLRALKDVRDSKQLSPARRDELFAYLTTLKGVRFAVASSSAHVIDTRGIVPAVTRALERALAQLTLDPATTRVLLDGSLRAPAQYKNQQTIIRGDATEPLIGAASILAKVTRDRYMCRMDRRFPEYGFARHKGYGTALHLEKIAHHGLSPLHRASFLAGRV